MTLKNKKKIIGTAFITPWFIGFLLFFLVPVAQTLYFSFHTITTTETGYQATYEGISNFIYAFRGDATFPQVLASSMLQLLSDVPFVLVFSFFMAVILHQKFRGNGLVKMILFMTVILSTGVFPQFQENASAVQTSQFSAVLAENDTVSGVLQGMQIEQYIVEMGLSEKLANYLVAPMQRLFAILSHSGIQIFIFLAALNTIPASLYESSCIEGATGWENFWKITLPMVSPMILVNVVYTIVDSFFSSSNKALEYVQRTLFTDIKFGYGSALAWIYFIIISVILLIVLALISRRVFYYDK